MTAADPVRSVVASTASAEARSLETNPFRWPAWAIACLIPGLLFLALGFSGTFRALWGAWDQNPNYSHGFIIPPISAFLAWRKRKVLRAMPPASSWLGLSVLGFGVVLQIAGIRGDVTILQGWAFLLILTGGIWTWFGFGYVRALVFPLGFLLFMVPAIPAFMNKVSFELKSVAASGAVELASALGVPVIRRGMDLHFPSGFLTVENACSGLNSLIALMALGALFGHLSGGATWKRWVLFGTSIPVAIGANIVRIASLCVCAAFAGTETASGLFHDIGGFVLFGVALLLLLGFKAVLRC